jgi:hypothetical protein
MTPQDVQHFWPAFIVFGVPLIILAGGPYGWRALVILGALAGIAYAPWIAGAACALFASHPAPMGSRGLHFRLGGRARGAVIRCLWIARAGGAGPRKMVGPARPERRLKMALTVIDAVIAAVALKWSADNLDPGTFQLGLLIVVAAVVWHFIR